MKETGKSFGPVLEDVFRRVGSKTALADALGIRPQAINNWTRVPANRVRAVSDLTGIPDYVLRPDLYRKPSKPTQMYAA